MNDFDNEQICSYKDIDRFGFTCDVCGRKVNGCHIVNGMKFCAKCYQEIFGKYNQQNEIQQLKQQLAEKQNTIDEINKEFVQAVHDWKTLCAEKDKHIIELENKISSMEEQDMIFHNQLAIQELEKVKEYMNSEYGYDCCADVSIVDEFIDNQIKELKGAKDDEEEPD